MTASRFVTYRDNPPWWLITITGMIIVLNLYDAIMTMLVVESGLAIEANPLMALPLEHGPGFFMAAKISLVSLGTFILWRLRYKGWAVASLITVFLVYLLVAFYHIQSIKALTHYFG